MTSGPAQPAAGREAPDPGPERRQRHPWRRLAVPAITVTVLVAVFVGLFPRFANYSQAWSSIRRIPVGYLIAIVGAALVNIAVGAWPLQAALPGLHYRPAFVVGQTSFALSNTVPAGGAIGLGIEYDMLESYGFGTGAASSAAVISTVFNIFATLVMPVIGVLALLVSGEVRWHYVLIAGAGVVGVGIALAGFALILRSEEGARRVGRAADRLVGVTTGRWMHGRTFNLTGKVLDFRTGVIGVIRTQWAFVIGSTLLPQFTSWLVLLLTVRGLSRGTHTGFSVTWADSLAAFSFALILSFVPVTVGGLGTVDAALTGLLTAFGATASHALAVDLVWRAGTYLPQVLTGGLMFALWQVTAGRRRRTRPTSTPPSHHPP